MAKLSPTPWYAKTSTKLLIGIAGIVILIGVLIGVKTAFSANQAPPQSTTDGTQIVQMTVSSRGYDPSSFTIQAGKPVRWVITGTNSMGCASFLVSPTLGLRKQLQVGQNVIEFTAPTQPGTYGFSCSMGMYRGTMQVV